MPITTQQARQLVDEIASLNRAMQGRAYEALLAATESTVPWTYDIWHDIVQGLGRPLEGRWRFGAPISSISST
jgi:hypothetical protein